MPREIDPRETDREAAYHLWMGAPNPMVTVFKTLDVTAAVRLSRRRGLKFHMLLDYCIGQAAAGVREFYTLPVGKALIRYDELAVSTIVANRSGGVTSCDIPCTGDLAAYSRRYLADTAQAAETGRDIDLSETYMVIGTSAIVETELDGVVGMNSGIYNNPFLFWGRYRRRGLRYVLPISFQFHHTQMDGAHAGAFLERLQAQLRDLR